MTTLTQRPDDANPPNDAGTDTSKGFDRKATGHGMLNAFHYKNRWGVAFRHVLLKIVSKLPGTRFKSRLMKRMFNLTMGEDVGIAYAVMLDPFEPSMISFGDNVLVGTETRFFVHTFMLNRQRVRPIKVGSNVQIGAFCVIAPGVTIGDGASIAPCTLVSRNVPAGAIVMGNQMQIKRRNLAPNDAPHIETSKNEAPPRQNDTCSEVI
ncbi:MAG: acyltransferase [Planctomycetota bacterium]|nr:acyltransferase [Planctomycetota bacterium]